MSLILLIGASLLTRSLANLQNQDLGLQVNNRYVVGIDPKSAGYTEATLPVLYQSIEQRFRAVPGAEHVGMALYAPLEGTSWSSKVQVPGRKQGQPGGPGANAQSQAISDRISPDFFAAVGEPLIQGRAFADSDSGNSQGVAIVNEAFVKRFFPNESPIGRSFGSQTRPSEFQIVGVVADAKFVDVTKKADPVFFRPLSQPVLDGDGKETEMETLAQYADCIVLDFKTPPGNVDRLVRPTLTSINSNLAVLKIQTFSYQIGANFIQDRLPGALGCPVWCAGFSTGRRWTLRRDLLPGGAQNLRNRGAHGSWCDASIRVAAGAAWSFPAGRHRPGDRIAVGPRRCS